MKKIWGLSLTVVVCVAFIPLYAFNPFKKKDWEKAGKTIKGGVEDAGKGIVSAGKDAGTAAKAVFSDSADCKEMKRLTLVWAAKEAEYAATQAAINLAVKNVEKLQALVKAGTDAGKAGADISSAVLNLGSSAINKGINITKVYFNGRLDGLAKGAFPAFQIKGTAFGKPFDIKMQLNIAKPVGMAKLLIQNIF